MFSFDLIGEGEEVSFVEGIVNVGIRVVESSVVDIAGPVPGVLEVRSMVWTPTTKADVSSDIWVSEIVMSGSSGKSVMSLMTRLMRLSMKVSPSAVKIEGLGDSSIVLVAMTIRGSLEDTGVSDGVILNSPGMRVVSSMKNSVGFAVKVLSVTVNIEEADVTGDNCMVSESMTISENSSDTFVPETVTSDSFETRVASAIENPVGFAVNV